MPARHHRRPNYSLLLRYLLWRALAPVAIFVFAVIEAFARFDWRRFGAELIGFAVLACALVMACLLIAGLSYRPAVL